MSLTITWSQGDVETLRAAIASATLTVRYGGPPAREQTYQNVTEMKRALAQIIADQNNADGSRRSFRTATFKSGL